MKSHSNDIEGFNVSLRTAILTVVSIASFVVFVCGGYFTQQNAQNERIAKLEAQSVDKK